MGDQPAIAVDHVEAAMPSNHRLAERKLIALVQSGEWAVDADGRIWRNMLRSGHKKGGVNVTKVAPRRVERTMPSGYLLLQHTVRGVVVTGMAHRLVWQHFFGDIPTGLVINHKNGRKGDNRPENLEVVTNSENLKHAFACLNATVLRGSKNGSAKLTESDVIDMRIARASGTPLAELAARFGVSFGTVSDICRGERWQHVKRTPLATVDGRLLLRRERNSASGRFLRDGEANETPDMAALSFGNVNAKLSEQDVREIRSLAAQGARPKDIAARFGVTAPTVCKVIHRQTWAHTI